QRRSRRRGGDRFIGGQRRLPFLLLLARQTETGERAEAHARVDVADSTDGLERLDRLGEAPLLELRLAEEQPRLGPDAVVVALGRGLGEHGGVLPVLLLDRGRG